VKDVKILTTYEENLYYNKTVIVKI
jgi:hypothetical protein